MSMSKVFQDILSSDGTLFYFLAKKPHKVPRAREQLSKLSGKLDYLSELSVALKEG